MDLSLVIYTAMGAGIGTLIGRLLNKLHKTEVNKPRLYSVIFTVLGLTILPLLYRNMYLPRIIPLNASDFGESAVFYQSLQKHDPVAYANVLKPLDRITRKGDLSPEGLQEVRVVLDEVLASKRKTANLEALRKETELAIWQFKILKDNAPEVCVQKAHGRPFKNLTSVLSDDYRNNETALMVAYIENPKRPENIIVDRENGGKLFTGFAETSKAALELVNIDPPENDIVAQEDVCKLLIVIHEKILNAKDQEVYDIYAYING